MKQRLLDYLQSEYLTAALWILFGVITLGLGAWFFLRFAEGFHQGLGLSGGILALLHFWSGGRLLLRTRRLERELPPLLQRDPERYRYLEKERCEKLERFYTRQRQVILLFIALGILLALAGGVMIRQPFSAGMGFALCIQGAILLVFNLTAQWRSSMHYYEVDQGER